MDKLAIPADLNPPGHVCLKVFLPAEASWITSFFRLLSYPAWWHAWQKDDLKQGTAAAARYREAYTLTQAALLAGETCGDCGDMGIQGVRQSDNCTLQYTENGETWLDFADLSLCAIPGPVGPAGSDAPIPEFRVFEGVLQYRVGSGSWNDLWSFALNSGSSSGGCADDESEEDMGGVLDIKIEGGKLWKRMSPCCEWFLVGDAGDLIQDPTEINDPAPEDLPADLSCRKANLFANLLQEVAEYGWGIQLVSLVPVWVNRMMKEYPNLEMSWSQLTVAFYAGSVLWQASLGGVWADLFPSELADDLVCRFEKELSDDSLIVTQAEYDAMKNIISTAVNSAVSPYILAVHAAIGRTGYGWQAKAAPDFETADCSACVEESILSNLRFTTPLQINDLETGMAMTTALSSGAKKLTVTWGGTEDLTTVQAQFQQPLICESPVTYVDIRYTGNTPTVDWQVTKVPDLTNLKPGTFLGVTIVSETPIAGSVAEGWRTFRTTFNAPSTPLIFGWDDLDNQARHNPKGMLAGWVETFEAEIVGWG